MKKIWQSIWLDNTKKIHSTKLQNEGDRMIDGKQAESFANLLITWIIDWYVLEKQNKIS